ncbi:Cytochrome c [Chryseolinea serpens]|uniref:Cytochrome c n=1 Tax=Chryseolinea serpens TaxID=947013 RepID=A0A1M5USV7_9BACT|nr:c-type cytochrome [Chryseolinea serpens]SHH66016.1 Cytochrome c [Chryseolinea serpens]
MKKFLKIAGLVLGLVVLCIAGLIFYVAKFLPDVGAAPIMKVDAGPAQIERGRYLANNVMVCMDCHSTRNWAEFSGPIVPGTLGQGGFRFDQKSGFPGVYYAANITPAALSAYTDGEIFRAVTTGVKRNGQPIFPVMPHGHYGKMDVDDIHAVIAYVRTLAPIVNTPPASHSDFPMNIIINTLPAKAAFTERPDTTDVLAYGAYLVNAAACYDCHTPFDKGAYDDAFAFAGGRLFTIPSGDLRSANITPDESGIGNWSKEFFVARFTAYRDSANSHRAVDPAKDFNTVMPWTMYANMTEGDLAAIYTYLKTLKPIANPVTKFTPLP